ncbi:hypothetical protein [uncultured Jannaschia sp.]|uniref:hypothetical protein n=1 Tax=uncultured Jannaschia sp. TaxID=293347 RepID=UPI00260CF068|nr:hypothetical protein [uncultured Jannaschia sp.]
MFRCPIAAIVALALALSFAAPAQADRKDALRVIGGLVALYALSEIIERNRDGTAPDVPVARSRPAEVVLGRAAPTAPNRSPRPVARIEEDRLPPWDPPFPYDTMPAPRETRILPEQCHDAARVPDGPVAGYEAACMRNAVARPGLLPPRCLRRIGTETNPKALYAARCLEAEGWTPRTARR